MKKKDIIHQETYYIAFEDLEYSTQVYFFFTHGSIYSIFYYAKDLILCFTDAGMTWE